MRGSILNCPGRLTILLLPVYIVYIMEINITKPTLLLNSERVKRNIKRMADKALISGVNFRPHFKTHQSVYIAEFFKEESVSSITVSSLDMAVYFSRAGWKDISVAFPVNIKEIETINRLAGSANLHLLVESEETVSFLSNNLLFTVNIWIKIDVGSKRTGIDCRDFTAVKELARQISSSDKLRLMGLLTHAGHSYKAAGKDEVKNIYRDMVNKLYDLKDKLRDEGYDDIMLSVGDTPTCSLVADLSEVDEIRPGNFVFYDVTQVLIGSCTEEDIAVALACPVVAKHRDRMEIVVYGGAVHVSKDSVRLKDGTLIYGLTAFGNSSRVEDGWGRALKNSYVKSVSQEHGVIKLDKEYFDRIKIGDVIYILPVHSCLTANLMRSYTILNSGQVVDIRNV